MKRQVTGLRRRRSKTATSRPVADHPAGAGPALTEPQYHLVFEHSLIGMYRTTLRGRILDCNESMARMLGYRSRRELLNHKAGELYHTPGDRRAFLGRLRRTGVLTNSELALRCKDGTTMYVLENVCLVREKSGSLLTIQGTMVDITARKLAEEALRESERRHRELAGELRRLAHHMQAVREAERARIARELHDELGQYLTALNMDLHWLRERAAHQQDMPVARVAAMHELVGRAIVALRRICTDLRPALLDDMGLIAAIEWQAREFQVRTGVRCVASLPAAPVEVAKEQATAVFRILQESLTNIARHARATEVRIVLQARAKLLTLKVSDNGVGMAGARPGGVQSLGLMGMRERAIEWNGQVEVSDRSAKGTTVTLRMPLGQVAREGTP
ncbi:MAG TPA: PAS domain-containing sensor histidine kinase [Phycisphaerae bacterium]|nr:PAS domain-containing sensor histidine kinase [Phycisphaerae bacterium]HNU46862.1 PAS domain-containing sensor histidine kinase [Phycisphaerae bacterium]